MDRNLSDDKIRQILGDIEKTPYFTCLLYTSDAADDMVEYVPNNPDIIEDAKTAQKEAAASHPVHTPSK